MRRQAVLVAVLALAASCGTGEPPRGDQASPVAATAHLKFAVPPNPGDVALQFDVIAAHCIEREQSVVEKVDVSETAQAVTVTAHRAEGISEANCTKGAALYVRIPVSLKAALGTRRVLDGSCAPPVEVVGVEEGREPCTPSDQQKAEVDAVGAWKEFAAGPLSPRGEPKGAWNGKELIVVGGLALEQYRALNDGAAYNPTTNTWRRIPDLPIEGRVHAVAATSDGLLALMHPGSDLSVFDTPAAYVYSAASNAWRDVPPPKAILYPHALWTGKDVIVWGGNGGAIFNDATSAWRDIPALDVAGGATSSLAAAGGPQWLPKPGVLAVQGDYDPRDGSPSHSALFLFDPATNRWRKAADPPRALAAGGTLAIGNTDVFDVTPTLAYDASANTWREIDAVDEARDGGTGYFTGVDLGEGRGVARVAHEAQPLTLLDLASGHWSHASSPGRLPAADAVMVWSGDAVLLWGRPANIQPDDRNAAWAWTPPAKS